MAKKKTQIPKYGTITLKGIQYYRTRITDADGKELSLYAATASRAPENTPAMVKKIGKTTYKVHVHFSNTSTETMSDKIKRMLKNEIQQM